MRNYIHIVLSADDNYAKYLAVTLVSVLCNRADEDELYFHILDGGIAPESKCTIEAMVVKQGACIEFLPINQSLFSSKVLNITEKDHVTQAAYYRLLIPSLIKEERCIYMDCDIVCRASLAPIWKTDLGSSIVAAVKDIDENKQAARLNLKRYFNSGVLLMDLEAMRSEKIQDQFFHFITEQYERIVLHDQDVLNCVLHGRIHELDMTWNCQVCKSRSCKVLGFHALSQTANILHYIGHRKPWCHGCRAPQRKEYWYYIKKTPMKPSFGETLMFCVKNVLTRLLLIFK